MKVLSLFDGMSCTQIALNRAGIEYSSYHASEIDKYAIKVTQQNYPNTTQLGDVTQVKGGDYDLIVGGFPCQSYSIAGKRNGINSKNGNLIYEVFRIVEAIQPELVLLENVKGLVTIDKGDTFKFILSELNRIGYAVDFININSSLVSAQNRERVYIIAKRLDKCKGLEYITDLNKEFINATLKKVANRGDNISL